MSKVQITAREEQKKEQKTRSGSAAHVGNYSSNFKCLSQESKVGEGQRLV